MNEAQVFRRTLTPYSRKCLIRTAGPDELFAPGWIDDHKPLTDERIEAAILGRLAVAYMAAASPRAIGIDIDDHTGRGNTYRLEMYERTRARFSGLMPSIVASSPRGLHVWYILEAPIPWTILEPYATAAVKGLAVELRPTPSLGLRIPAEAELLDPATLLPLHRGFKAVFEDAEIERSYHPAEIFGTGILPASVRSTLRERKARYGAFLGRSAIRKAEEENPFLPGCTNASLNALVPLYRSAGLTAEDTARRVYALLPPVYIGELRNWGRLLSRVKSYYRHAPDPKPVNRQASLFSDPIAESVASLWKGRVQNTDSENTASGLDDAHIRTTLRGRALGNESFRLEQGRASVRRLVNGILEWNEFITDIRGDPLEHARCRYLYPYFSKNTREGFTPLPQSVLRRIDANYHRFFPFLIASGFLEKAPYQYVPGAGICNYYRLRLDRFIGALEPQNDTKETTERL